MDSFLFLIGGISGLIFGWGFMITILLLEDNRDSQRPARIAGLIMVLQVLVMLPLIHWLITR